MAKKPKFTNGDDNINLGKGDDVANAKGGNDVVAGGSGDDTINGGAGNDFLRGGTGDDTLNGGEGDDRLSGGVGDDTLNGGAGINIVDGGDGDDLVVLDGNFADAKITADGAGFKIVTAAGTSTVTNVENFQFADGVKAAADLLGTGGGKTFILTVPIDNIVGTSGDDTIIGDQATLTADLIAGGDGKDKLVLAASTALNGTPTMSGVESVTITNSADATLNLANVKDVTSFSIANGNGDIKLNGANSIAELSLTSVGSATSATDVTLSYAAAAVVGTADALKVNLDNVTLKGATGDLTFAGIETLTLAAAGTADTIQNVVGGTALKSVVTSGVANLTATFDATGTGLTSYDSSTATGKQNITFNAVSDVAVKGGSADDRFAFGATLSSKDSVDGGAGTDTVAVAGADFQAGDGLTGLNALKNVERLQFTGAGPALINDTTLTAVLSAIVFDTTAAGADTVVDAVATSAYVFGTDNAGAATFTMKAGETTLNLAATGDLTATTTATRDADVGILSTGTASVVNYTSTGLATVGEANDIATVTATATTLFNLKGDGNTTIGGFTNAANFDASSFTGTLNVTGSASADTLRAGAGGSTVDGAAAADAIFLTSSTTKVDTVVETQSFATHEAGEAAIADTITGFTAGVGGDKIKILDANTTPAGTLVLQEGGTTDPTILATTDVFEFTLNVAASLAGDDGTALYTALGAANVVATNGWDGYIIAYSGGNAYLYVIDEAAAGTAVIDAETEVAQVAVFNNVAVGALDVSNFTL